MGKVIIVIVFFLLVAVIAPAKTFAHEGGLVIDRPVTASESTQLNLTVLIHGIGRSGDSVNPTGSTLSNKNPLHPSRPVVLQLLNESLQVVSTLESTMDFRNEGVFVSTVSLPTDLPAGSYQLKARTKGTLWQWIPVNQTLILGQENNLPEVDLVVGDSTDDGRLDVRDYNTLMLCFMTDTKGPSSACDAKKKEQADITDDGIVNQSDYNLFLREFVTHPSGE